jgi:alginate O-acetyltransferase complex protein AlgI
MLFNSIEFLLFFLPIVFTGFYLLRNTLPGALLPWLTASSLFFYAWWEPRYLVLLLGSALFNYVAGHCIARSTSESLSKYLLGLGVLVNLALLGYYKYATFIISNVASAFYLELSSPSVLLPLAISFFTFQQIAYLADAHVEKNAEQSPLRYLLFVCFFPQLIAGPIVHHKEIMGQFSGISTRFNASLVAPAIALIIMGLGKKVLLADTLSVLVGPGFTIAENAGDLTAADAWVASTAYCLQLYFDFSGYCDIALGAALLFGVRLPINFNSPYQASNIIDFWRRWHMTLSRFLRDYLYIPLGGNRRGKSRRYANLYLTMLLGGLWHGADWTFVLWGSMHGAYLVFNHAWRRVSASWPERHKSALWKVMATTLTFLCTLLAFVYFRAEDASSASHMVEAMFTGSFSGLSSTYEGLLKSSVSGDVFDFLFDGIGYLMGSGAILAVGLFVVFLMPNTMVLIRANQLGFQDTASVRSSWQINLQWRKNTFWGVAMGLILWAVFISLTSVSPFLYFQF